MGNSVIYWGSDDDPRTQRARELAPDDLKVGYIDPATAPAERNALLKDCQFLIGATLALDTEALSAMPGLKTLQIMSAGFDGFDVPALREMGIEVCNNSAAIANAVAEHAIMLMLAVYKRTGQGIEGARDGSWQTKARSGPRGHLFELTGKTVGIVGIGHIGSLLAKRLQGFETSTLYYDVRLLPSEMEEELRVASASFDELLERSDVVTAHMPLNSVTRGMFSTREFRLMKRDAVFINTCRGPVHNEKALIAALRDGDIRAAGLDVTEVEPTPLDNPLLHMENVIVTPHLAGSSQERVDRALVFAFDNARRVLEGRKPLSPVVVQD